jgi:hypothetical protein
MEINVNARLNPKRSPYRKSSDSICLDEWEIDLLKCFNYVRNQAITECRRKGKGARAMIVDVVVERNITEVKVRNMTPGDGYSYSDVFEITQPKRRTTRRQKK